MRRFMLLFTLSLLFALLAPTSAGAGDANPWYTWKGVPVQPAAAQPPGAGLVGGGGADISGDGRFIATVAGAPNGFPGCVSSACLAFVVINTETGEADYIAVAYNGESILSLIVPVPSISDDGRYVAYPQAGVWLFDRVTRETSRVDRDGNVFANPAGTGAQISGDGRHVAFASSATNIGAPASCPNSQGPGCPQVFVFDVDAQELEMVSVTSDEAPADGSALNPAISYSGRFVSFSSQAGNLGGASDVSCLAGLGQMRNCSDIYVRDRQAGTTVLASPSTGGGQGNGDSSFSSISDDGNVVAFTSSATNLVPGDTNQAGDVFARDISGGVTERVSVTSGGGQTENGSSSGASVSGNGRRVAFASTSTTLDPAGPALCGITNIVCSDIFVHERNSRSTYKVSVSDSGDHGDGRSDAPVISSNGRLVVFRSGATNLAPDVPGGFFLGARRSDFTWGDHDCDGAIGALDALRMLLEQQGIYSSQGSCPPNGTATTVDGQNVAWGNYDCAAGATPADVVPVLAFAGGAPLAIVGCPPVGLPAGPQTG
jgi:Tol biopolymer transport system component